MSWFDNASPKIAGSEISGSAFSPRQAMMLGALSPLWMMYMGASTMGMAYWGMTRWMTTMAKPERFSAPVVQLRLVKPVARPVAVPDPVAVETPVAAAVAPEPVAKAAEAMVKAATPAPVKKAAPRKAAVKKPVV
jgi:hypothetical protein